MYARSTTVRGNPDKTDEEIAYVRDEVMPALHHMSGCVGLSMLADRDSGRCIITSAWADEGAMQATEQSVQELRQRAAEIMGGEHEVQAWEIPIMHRAHLAHDGARSRLIWGTQDPAGVDDRLAQFRAMMLPRMEQLPGFCSISLMVDRASGRTVTSLTYDTREALEQHNDRSVEMIRGFTAAVGLEVTEVAEFDLVLAHLGVPETV